MQHKSIMKQAAVHGCLLLKFATLSVFHFLLTDVVDGFVDAHTQS